MTTDCWNVIGVRGTGTCPELTRHVHCRNCPVYGSAASALLDRELSAPDLQERTARIASPPASKARATESIVIFRVANEWLALPTRAVTEVADARPVHSLPHRRGGAVLGVASVRGELLVCISLARLLGLDAAGAGVEPRVRRTVHPRLLVLRRHETRVLCPADEVDGIHDTDPTERQDVPQTVAKAAGRVSRAVIAWRGRSVGLLDDDLLFQSVQRSLA
jgi:chemotaxis-related protein WspD